MTIDEARAQLADIRQTCHIARLADLRDGEMIEFSVDDAIDLVSVTVSRHDGRDDQHFARTLPLLDMGRHPLLLLIGPVGFVAAIAVELLSHLRFLRGGGRAIDLLSAAHSVMDRS